MPKKTTTTITIQGIHVESDDPAVMDSAFKLIGNLLSAFMNPVFGEPPIAAKPKALKKRTTKDGE